MNEAEVEELLRRSAPEEAPFGPRRPAFAPPARRPWIVPLAAAAALFAAVLASILRMPAPDEAERHVRLLESADVAAREAAARALLQLGDAAKPALERAARHGSADLKERASALLRLIHVQEVEKRTGRLTKDGDFWIDSSTYGAVARRTYPVWMEAHFQVDTSSYMLIVNETDGGLASMLTKLRWPEGRRRDEVLPCINLIWGQNDLTWQQFRDEPIPLERRDLAELFERWPRLRDSSLVIVCAREVISAFQEALASGEPRLRAAAAHGLRHVFSNGSVDLALGALDDPDERVRAAARDTLRVLVNPPADADPRAWWRDLAPKERHLRARCDERRKELSR